MNREKYLFSLRLHTLAWIDGYLHIFNEEGKLLSVFSIFLVVTILHNGEDEVRMESKETITLPIRQLRDSRLFFPVNVEKRIEKARISHWLACSNEGKGTPA